MVCILSRMTHCVKQRFLKCGPWKHQYIWAVLEMKVTKSEILRMQPSNLNVNKPFR